jgi:L,D-transpeptidase YbiS
MRRLYKRNKLIYLSAWVIGLVLVLFFPVSETQAPVVCPADNTAIVKEYFRNEKIERFERNILVRERNINALHRMFLGDQPEKPYLVVNSAANEIRLLKSGKLIHQGKCSTGSYILLKASHKREWLFRTPRGAYRVTVKLKDPWWYKPDWAYVEENLPIPSKYSPKRYQPGVLGDYALGFGNGYLVHGTLYKRFLGMPVTHGCVRLDDEDMALVFKTLRHGSRIYIY